MSHHGPKISPTHHTNSGTKDKVNPMKWLAALLTLLTGLGYGQTTAELVHEPTAAVTVDAAGQIDDQALVIGEAAPGTGARALLSLDLSALPEGATVLAARLELHVAGQQGSPSALGRPFLELQPGAFNGDPLAEPEDYAAPAAVTRAAVLLGDGPLVAHLDARGLGALAGNSPLQIRIAYPSEDNGDATVDQLQLHGPGASDANLRPRLSLTYTTDGATLTPVSLTLAATPDLVTSPGITLSGSVVPADAQLFLAGEPVATDAAGAFSIDHGLFAGINDLTFIARAYPHAEARLVRVVTLDTVGPTISITSPTVDHHTNAATLSIAGIVSDDHDRPPSLTRDGVTIPVVDGRFVEHDLPLTNGSSTFTYSAVDAAGNQGQPVSLTVHRNDIPPAISLDVADQIEAGSPLALNATLTPADTIAEVRVFLASRQVHAQYDGSPLALQLEPDPEQDSQILHISARDIYGNLAEVERTLTIGRTHIVRGRLRDNATSQPLAGMEIKLETPLAQQTLTTDGEGAFQTEIKGAPLTARVRDPRYLAADRFHPADQTGIDLGDLRLIQPAANISTSFRFLRYTVSHGGSSHLTRLDPQALPTLLPLGVAPLIGVALTDTAQAGDLHFLNPALNLPAGSRVLLLRQEGAGWRVLRTSTTTATLDQTVAGAGDGVWLLAVADSDATAEPAAVGDLLRRERFRSVPLGRISDLSTDPSNVSLLEEPETELTLFLADNDLPSGVTVAVRVEEIHQLIDGTADTRTDQLQLTSYRTYQSNGAIYSRAVARVRAQPIDRALTQAATMAFQPLREQAFTPQYPDGRPFQIGGLSLDFGAAGAGIGLDLHALLDTDLPLASRSERVLAFRLWTGGPLTEAPRLTYAGRAEAAAGATTPAGPWPRSSAATMRPGPMTRR